MRGHGLDILWSYAASLARVLSWVVVYAALYRTVSTESAALLVLVRWTLGLLNYASAGLGPAILHHAAKAGADRPDNVDALSAPALPTAHPLSQIGKLRSPLPIYRAGITLSWLGALLGALLLWSWCLTEGQARHVAALVGLFGTGMLIDIAADAYGAVLQSRGRMRTDYQFQSLLEAFWAITATTLILTRRHTGIDWQLAVGGAYLAAAITTASLRGFTAHRLMRHIPSVSSFILLPSSFYRPLLSFGGFVMLAQVADYLYAPTDYQLILWLIDLRTVSVYANAIMIDAGILLLVGGLANAVLPISAAAFGRNDFKSLRRFYLQGTAITFALLLVTSVLAWLAAPAIFKFWLGDKLRDSRAILPWVLVPTVVGGSAAVGRSILLAIGKVKPFTAAVLLSALANVACSIAFVKYANLGLRGIVLGTIVAVTARCAIWMPWYVLRSLRRAARLP